MLMSMYFAVAFFNDTQLSLCPEKFAALDFPCVLTLLLSLRSATTTGGCTYCSVAARASAARRRGAAAPTTAPSRRGRRR